MLVKGEMVSTTFGVWMEVLFNIRLQARCSYKTVKYVKKSGFKMILTCIGGVVRLLDCIRGKKRVCLTCDLNSQKTLPYCSRISGNLKFKDGEGRVHVAVTEEQLQACLGGRNADQNYRKRVVITRQSEHRSIFRRTQFRLNVDTVT